MLLQSLFLAFRSLTYPNTLTRLSQTPTALIIHQIPKRPDTYFRFPAHIPMTETQEKMVLSTLGGIF
jgi:hypothetical protein